MASPHIDIKPENIMLDGDGHVRIIDLGLARDDVTASSTICGRAGTYRYMAPEILQDKAYSTAVDWWSLGIVVSRMAYGHSPFFDGHQMQQVYKSITTDKPKFPTWLQVDLKHLIKKLLRKDPESRLSVTGKIRGHPFFGTICWEDLEQRRVVPPFKPFPVNEEDKDDNWNEKSSPLLDSESDSALSISSSVRRLLRAIAT
ncbi:positive regulation of sphingomyelin catabolic process, partial [Pristimantis euphronides]